MFVPATLGGKLMEFVERAEQDCRKETCWDVKLIEKPGTPLVMSFIKKLPMLEGCILGEECGVCENKGVKCNRKNVVHKASCDICEEKLHGLLQLDDNNKPPVELMEY